MEKLREEDGLNLDEDDDAVWQGWDIESNDSAEDSDEDEDWINVDDDEDGPLVISGDSEDENEKAKNDQATPSLESLNPPRISTLATSKVSVAISGVFVYSYVF